MEQEYIVTLKSRADLEDFYNDMETSCVREHTPNRAVGIVHRRPTSRNTHYMLTAEEAAEVARDPRVIAVERPRGPPEESWVQTSSNWAKGAPNILPAGLKNWGLLRCTLGEHVPGWGVVQSDPDKIAAKIAGTAVSSLSGRGVDFVASERGTPRVDHPEFWVSDTNQQSRFVQYNWYQHLSAVSGGAISNSTYQYTPYFVGDVLGGWHDHATSVAGAAVGRTQGFARSATVYGIGRNMGRVEADFNDSTGLGRYTEDLIRAWHNSKPVDPQTGIRRPTIVNYSVAWTGQFDMSNIRSIRFRGNVTLYPTGITVAQALAAALIVTNNNTAVLTPDRVAAIDADIADMVADGIIVTSAAGNRPWLQALPSTDPADDWNNYFTTDSGETVYYCRGQTPGIAPGVVTVGATAGHPDFDAITDYTSRGAGIDVFAPGDHLVLPVARFSTTNFSVEDPPGSGFYAGRNTGTSFAAPLVAGVIACVAEANPRLSPIAAVEYVRTILNKPNQLTEGALPSGSATGGSNLVGGANRYLYCQLPRPLTGSVQHTQQTPRPSTGAVWPRAKNLR